MEIWHYAPIQLEPGSIINPGNWGRIISEAGPSHHCFAQEQVLENIRAMTFPYKPSRLRCNFAFRSKESAIAYQTIQQEKGGYFNILYRVVPLLTNPSVHFGDYNLVEVTKHATNDVEANNNAGHYWANTTKTEWSRFPGVSCEELLVESPFGIVAAE